MAPTRRWIRSATVVGRLLALLSCMWIGPALGADEPGSASNDTTRVPTKYDLAVPDVPALKILGEPTEGLLQPGTRRELAVVLGGANFKDYALEVAPFLVGTDNLITLRQYQRKAWLYRLRFSLASSTPVGEDTRVGFGVRLGLIDDADPLTDRERLGQLYEWGAIINSVHDSVLTAVTRSLGVDSVANMPDKVRDDLVRGLAAPRLVEIRAALESAVRDSARAHWNDRILELALAVSASARDSVFREFRASRYTMWLTGGFPLWRKGRIEAGGNLGLGRGAAGRVDTGEGLLGVRFAYGSNEMKVTAELNSEWQADSHGTHAGRAGFEFRMRPGIWLDLELGLSKLPGEATKTTSSINLRYGTPEPRD